MTENYVKPTIEQLQAELEWELGRSKRRSSAVVSFMAVLAVAVIAATAILPVVKNHTMTSGYALEETVQEEVPEEMPEQ